MFDLGDEENGSVVFDLNSNYYQLNKNLFVQYRDYIRQEMDNTGIYWDYNDQKAVCECRCSSLSIYDLELNIALGDNQYNIPAQTFVTETGKQVNHLCIIDIY